MTSLEICPNCGSTFRAYEDPDDGSVSGTCPQCRHYYTWGARKAEPEPTAAYEPGPAEIEHRATVWANTLIFIKDAGTHESEVAEIRRFFEERSALLGDARNARRDRHYYITGADVPLHEFCRFLDDQNIPGVCWTYPSSVDIFKREASA